VTAIPLAPLPPDVAEHVETLGAKQLNLYRALAHAPELLRAWIAFAWALRGHETTERRLRELMILRTATLHHSPYEWHQHRRMAREAGATDYEVAELEMWRTSQAFSDADRAALAFTDAIVAGEVPPAVNHELCRHFDESQRVELTVTAAFYSMVPRVLEALGVPIEESEEPKR
jgi:4-carboxymuconolactone decarboxylase